MPQQGAPLGMIPTDQVCSHLRRDIPHTALSAPCPRKKEVEPINGQRSNPTQKTKTFLSGLNKNPWTRTKDRVRMLAASELKYPNRPPGTWPVWIRRGSNCDQYECKCRLKCCEMYKCRMCHWLQMRVPNNTCAKNPLCGPANSGPQLQGEPSERRPEEVTARLQFLRR